MTYLARDVTFKVAGKALPNSLSDILLENGKTYGRILWPVELWPYVERESLYNQYDFTQFFYESRIAKPTKFCEEPLY